MRIFFPKCRNGCLGHQVFLLLDSAVTIFLDGFDKRYFIWVLINFFPQSQ